MYIALLPQNTPIYPAAWAHRAFHCPPASRAKVMVRVPNTVIRQPFLRRVHRKKQKVKSAHQAMMRVSPTLNPAANGPVPWPPDRAAEVAARYLLTKKATQKEP